MIGGEFFPDNENCLDNLMNIYEKFGPYVQNMLNAFSKHTVELKHHFCTLSERYFPELEKDQQRNYPRHFMNRISITQAHKQALI